MIACAGSYLFDAGVRADWNLNAYATMPLEVIDPAKLS